MIKPSSISLRTNLLEIEWDVLDADQHGIPHLPLRTTPTTRIALPAATAYGELLHDRAVARSAKLDGE